MATEKHKIQLQRWKVLIQEQMNSKLKLLKWCKQNNVSKDSYYYWFKKIQIEAESESNSESKSESESINKVNKTVTSESNAFVEIKPATSSIEISDSINSRTSAIIRGNCFEIELFDEASSTFIRKLMEAMKYA